jgi:hypothetical protein
MQNAAMCRAQMLHHKQESMLRSAPLQRRLYLVVASPQCNGWVAAQPQQLLRHLRLNIGHKGAIPARQ